MHAVLSACAVGQLIPRKIESPLTQPAPYQRWRGGQADSRKFSAQTATFGEAEGTNSFLLIDSSLDETPRRLAAGSKTCRGSLTDRGGVRRHNGHADLLRERIDGRPTATGVGTRGSSSRRYALAALADHRERSSRLFDMDFSDPTRAVTPTLDGPVLAVLAASGPPVTVGEVAAQAVRGSEIGVRRCLARLVSQGIVRATRMGRNVVHE